MKRQPRIPSYFRCVLRDPSEITPFVVQFLDSPFVDKNVPFPVPSFTELKQFLRAHGRDASLRRCFGALFDYLEIQDGEEEGVVTWGEDAYCNTLEVKSVLDLVFPLLEEVKARGILFGDRIEIGFALPLIMTNPRLPREEICSEILRYGGNARELAFHLHHPRPRRAPYEGALWIDLREKAPPKSREASRRGEAGILEVPIENPWISPRLHLSVSVRYNSQFRGYWLSQMYHLAANLRGNDPLPELIVEDWRDFKNRESGA
ncbi:MAG: hypothetical protein HYY65_03780 [Candidatus Tectomicrobia bacterium]|uniref:Uncharacterized protein n=1 Tax=Tectimicrobiota bacterium TaxID=2528274 RepID=A0A932GNP0_UNCTE|nr:hypothetical protein [Candidatus Tectomicrobia bacterium]